ncbi:hypothetical protein PCE1_001606 [Barthelona sp. PCE]
MSFTHLNRALWAFIIVITLAITVNGATHTRINGIHDLESDLVYDDNLLLTISNITAKSITFTTSFRISGIFTITEGFTATDCSIHLESDVTVIGNVTFDTVRIFFNNHSLYVTEELIFRDTESVDASVITSSKLTMVNVHHRGMGEFYTDNLNINSNISIGSFGFIKAINGSISSVSNGHIMLERLEFISYKASIYPLGNTELNFTLTQLKKDDSFCNLAETISQVVKSFHVFHDMDCNIVWKGGNLTLHENVTIQNLVLSHYGILIAHDGVSIGVITALNMHIYIEGSVYVQQILSGYFYILHNTASVHVKNLITDSFGFSIDELIVDQLIHSKSSIEYNVYSLIINNLVLQLSSTQEIIANRLKLGNVTQVDKCNLNIEAILIEGDEVNLYVDILTLHAQRVIISELYFETELKIREGSVNIGIIINGPNAFLDLYSHIQLDKLKTIKDKLEIDFKYPGYYQINEMQLDAEVKLRFRAESIIYIKQLSIKDEPILVEIISDNPVLLLGADVSSSNFSELSSIRDVFRYENVIGSCFENLEGSIFAFPFSICDQFTPNLNIIVSYDATVYLHSQNEAYYVYGSGNLFLSNDSSNTESFDNVDYTYPQFLLQGTFSGNIYVTCASINFFSTLTVFNLYSLNGIQEANINLLYKSEAPKISIDVTSLDLIHFRTLSDVSGGYPEISVNDENLIVELGVYSSYVSNYNIKSGLTYKIFVYSSSDIDSAESTIIFDGGMRSSTLVGFSHSNENIIKICGYIHLKVISDIHHVKFQFLNPYLLNFIGSSSSVNDFENAGRIARIFIDRDSVVRISAATVCRFWVSGTLEILYYMNRGVVHILPHGKLIFSGEGSSFKGGVLTPHPYSSIYLTNTQMDGVKSHAMSTFYYINGLCAFDKSNCGHLNILNIVIKFGSSCHMRFIQYLNSDLGSMLFNWMTNPLYLQIVDQSDLIEFTLPISFKYFGHLYTNIQWDKFKIMGDSEILLKKTSAVALDVCFMAIATVFDSSFDVVSYNGCTREGVPRIIPKDESQIIFTPFSSLTTSYIIFSDGIRVLSSQNSNIQRVFTNRAVLVQEAGEILDEWFENGLYELLPAETSIDIPNYFNGTVYHDASHKLEVHVGHNVTLRLDGKTNQPVEIHVSGGTLHLALTVHKVLKFVGSPDELILSGNATLTTSLLAMDPVLSCLVPSYFFVSASSDITVICEYGSVSVIATGDISITATLSLRHASFEGELADVTIQEAVEGAIGHVKSINLLTGGIVLSHPTTYITRNVHTGEVAIDCAIDHCSVVFPEESIFDGFVLASPEPTGVSIHVMDSKMYSTTVDCIVNATGETMLNGNFGSKIFAYKSIHLNSTTVKSLFLMPGSRATGVITATNVVMLPASRWNSINGNVLYLVNSPSALWSCGTCDVVYGNRYQLPFKFKAMSDLDVSFSMNDVMEENPVAIPPHVNAITVGEEFSDDKMTKDRVSFEDAPVYTSTPTIHTGDTFTHVFYRNFELKETITETNTHVFAYDVIVNSLIIRNTSSVRLAYRVDGDLVLDNSFAFLDADVTITGSITCNDCKIYMNAHTLRVESGVVLSVYTDESPEKGCGMVNGTLVTSSLVLNSDTSTRIVRASIETDSFIHMGDAIVETGAFIKTDSLSINGGWTSGAIVVNREFTIDDSIITQKELAANSTLSFESKAFTSGDFEHICELFTRVRIMGDIRITANFNCLRVVLRDAPNVDIIVKHARVYGRAGSIRVEEDGYLILPDLETHFTKLSIAGQFDLVSFTPHLTMLSIGTLSVETDCMTMFVHALSVDTLQIHNITVELRTLNLNVVNIESSSGKLISLAPMRTLRTVTDSSLEIEVPTQTTDLTITNSTVEFTDITHFTGSTAFVDSTVGLRSVSDIDDALRIDNSRVLVGNAETYITCVFSTESTIIFDKCQEDGILITGFALLEINGVIEYSNNQDFSISVIKSLYYYSVIVIRPSEVLKTTKIIISCSNSVLLVNPLINTYLHDTEPDKILDGSGAAMNMFREDKSIKYGVIVDDSNAVLDEYTSTTYFFLSGTVCTLSATRHVHVVSAGHLKLGIITVIGVFSGTFEPNDLSIYFFSYSSHIALFAGFKMSFGVNVDSTLNLRASSAILIMRIPTAVFSKFNLVSTNGLTVDVAVFDMDNNNLQPEFSYETSRVYHLRTLVMVESVSGLKFNLDSYMFYPNAQSTTKAPNAYIIENLDNSIADYTNSLVSAKSLKDSMKDCIVLCPDDCFMKVTSQGIDASIFIMSYLSVSPFMKSLTDFRWNFFLEPKSTIKMQYTYDIWADHRGEMKVFEDAYFMFSENSCSLTPDLFDHSFMHDFTVYKYRLMSSSAICNLSPIKHSHTWEAANTLAKDTLVWVILSENALHIFFKHDLWDVMTVYDKGSVYDLYSITYETCRCQTSTKSFKFKADSYINTIHGEFSPRIGHTAAILWVHQLDVKLANTGLPIIGLRTPITLNLRFTTVDCAKIADVVLFTELATFAFETDPTFHIIAKAGAHITFDTLPSTIIAMENSIIKANDVDSNDFRFFGRRALLDLSSLDQVSLTIVNAAFVDVLFKIRSLTMMFDNTISDSVVMQFDGESLIVNGNIDLGLALTDSITSIDFDNVRSVIFGTTPISITYTPIYFDNTIFTRRSDAFCFDNLIFKHAAPKPSYIENARLVNAAENPVIGSFDSCTLSGDFEGVFSGDTVSLQGEVRGLFPYGTVNTAESGAVTGAVTNAGLYGSNYNVSLSDGWQSQAEGTFVVSNSTAQNLSGDIIIVSDHEANTFSLKGNIHTNSSIRVRGGDVSISTFGGEFVDIEYDGSDKCTVDGGFTHNIAGCSLGEHPTYTDLSSDIRSMTGSGGLLFVEKTADITDFALSNVDLITFNPLQHRRAQLTNSPVPTTFGLVYEHTFGMYWSAMNQYSYQHFQPELMNSVHCTPTVLDRGTDTRINCTYDSEVTNMLEFYDFVLESVCSRKTLGCQVDTNQISVLCDVDTRDFTLKSTLLTVSKENGAEDIVSSFSSKPLSFSTAPVVVRGGDSFDLVADFFKRSTFGCDLYTATVDGVSVSLFSLTETTAGLRFSSFYGYNHTIEFKNKGESQGVFEFVSRTPPTITGAEVTGIALVIRGTDLLSPVTFDSASFVLRINGVEVVVSSWQDTDITTTLPVDSCAHDEISLEICYDAYCYERSVVLPPPSLGITSIELTQLPQTELIPISAEYNGGCEVASATNSSTVAFELILSRHNLKVTISECIGHAAITVYGTVITVSPPAPVITAFNPPLVATAGDVVFVYGDFLGSLAFPGATTLASDKMQLNKVVSPNELMVSVMEGTGATIDYSVEVGSVYTSDYTIGYQPPFIHSRVSGVCFSSTAVRLTGNNFGPSGELASAHIYAASGWKATVPVTVISHTSATLNLPPPPLAMCRSSATLLSETFSLTVNVDGQTSNPISVSYAFLPTIHPTEIPSTELKETSTLTIDFEKLSLALQPKLKLTSLHSSIQVPCRDLHEISVFECDVSLPTGMFNAAIMKQDGDWLSLNKEVLVFGVSPQKVMYADETTLPPIQLENAHLDTAVVLLDNVPFSAYVDGGFIVSTDKVAVTESSVLSIEYTVGQRVTLPVSFVQLFVLSKTHFANRGLLTTVEWEGRNWDSCSVTLLRMGNTTTLCAVSELGTIISCDVAIDSEDILADLVCDDITQAAGTVSGFSLDYQQEYIVLDNTFKVLLCGENLPFDALVFTNDLGDVCPFTSQNNSCIVVSGSGSTVSAEPIGKTLEFTRVDAKPISVQRVPYDAVHTSVVRFAEPLPMDILSFSMPNATVAKLDSQSVQITSRLKQNTTLTVSSFASSIEIEVFVVVKPILLSVSPQRMFLTQKGFTLEGTDLDVFDGLSVITSDATVECRVTFEMEAQCNFVTAGVYMIQLSTTAGQYYTHPVLLTITMPQSELCYNSSLPTSVEVFSDILSMPYIRYLPFTADDPRINSRKRCDGLYATTPHTVSVAEPVYVENTLFFMNDVCTPSVSLTFDDEYTFVYSGDEVVCEDYVSGLRYQTVCVVFLNHRYAAESVTVEFNNECNSLVELELHGHLYSQPTEIVPLISGGVSIDRESALLRCVFLNIRRHVITVPFVFVDGIRRNVVSDLVWIPIPKAHGTHQLIFSADGVSETGYLEVLVDEFFLPNATTIVDIDCADAYGGITGPAQVSCNAHSGCVYNDTTKTLTVADPTQDVGVTVALGPYNATHTISFEPTVYSFNTRVVQAAVGFDLILELNFTDYSGAAVRDTIELTALVGGISLYNTTFTYSENGAYTFPPLLVEPNDFIEVRFVSNTSLISNVFTIGNCNVGHTLSLISDECVVCGPGTYKNEIGNEPCAECPLSKTSVEGSSDINACFCSEGTRIEEGLCVPCDETVRCSSGVIQYASPDHYLEGSFMKAVICPTVNCNGDRCRNSTGYLCSVCDDGHVGYAFMCAKTNYSNFFISLISIAAISTIAAALKRAEGAGLIMLVCYVLPFLGARFDVLNLLTLRVSGPLLWVCVTLHLAALILWFAQKRGKSQSFVQQLCYAFLVQLNVFFCATTPSLASAELSMSAQAPSYLFLLLPVLFLCATYIKKPKTLVFTFVFNFSVYFIALAVGQHYILLTTVLLCTSILLFVSRPHI